MNLFVESANAIPPCERGLVSALHELFGTMLEWYEPMNSSTLVTAHNPRYKNVNDVFLGGAAAEAQLVASLHGTELETCITDVGNLAAMLANTERWHFSGHADLPLPEGKLALGLTDRDGKFVVADPNTLVKHLKASRGGGGGGGGGGSGGASDGSYGSALTLVLLNGCDSLVLGKKLFDNALAKFVVCWETGVNDTAARVFATGFWLEMHANTNLEIDQQIAKAFEAGKAAVETRLQGGTISGLESAVPQFALEDPAKHKPHGILSDGRYAAGVPKLLGGSDGSVGKKRANGSGRTTSVDVIDVPREVLGAAEVAIDGPEEVANTPQSTGAAEVSVGPRHRASTTAISAATRFDSFRASTVMLIPAPTPTLTLTTPHTQGVLVGQRVEIHSTSREDINGKCGVATEFHQVGGASDRTKDRYTVTLHDGEAFKLKPTNLRVLTLVGQRVEIHGINTRSRSTTARRNALSRRTYE